MALRHKLRQSGRRVFSKGFQPGHGLVQGFYIKAGDAFDVLAESLQTGHVHIHILITTACFS